MSRSPRKEVSSLRGAEPKTKGKGRSRRRSSSPGTLTYEDEDQFTDVTITVGDRTLYANSCILAYNSGKFMRQFCDDKEGSVKSGKAGKGGGSYGGKNKEVDLSDQPYNNIREMLTAIDPRNDAELSEDVAMRLLPLTDDYDMKRLRKACLSTLAKSYSSMIRKGRPGMVPTDTTIKYITLVDKYDDCDELKECCMQELVADPFSERKLATVEGFPEYVRARLMEKKLAIANKKIAQLQRQKAAENELRHSKAYNNK